MESDGAKVRKLKDLDGYIELKEKGGRIRSEIWLK